jgi:uncharacterized coiled-coil DUF342 family protein|nr:MAG TPA: hypothetical protein [Caudoviricetes sp.]
MTHEKYNKLQKKIDMLYSDFIDLAAEAEERDEDFSKVSNWLDNEIETILEWADTNDSTVLAELAIDYSKLKGMLLC